MNPSWWVGLIVAIRAEPIRLSKNIWPFFKSSSWVFTLKTSTRPCQRVGRSNLDQAIWVILSDPSIRVVEMSSPQSIGSSQRVGQSIGVIPSPQSIQIDKFSQYVYVDEPGPFFCVGKWRVQEIRFYETFFSKNFLRFNKYLNLFV